jgi:chitinase
LTAGSYSDLASNPGASSISPAYSVETMPVLPSLSITPTAAIQSEGNTDITNFTFTVTREGDASLLSTAAWTVSADPSSGVNGTDFSGSLLPSGIVTFDPGQFTQLITVQVSGDTAFEADESFTITLSSPTNATIAASSAEGIIRNDDLPPPEVSVSLSSVSLSEASPYAVVALTLSGPTTVPIAFTPFLDAGGAGVGFATIDADTASAIEWWDALNSIWTSAVSGITIPPGSTSALLRISLANDTTYEGLETFQVLTGPFSGPVINNTGASGVVTIADDGSTANAFDGSTISATPISGSADNDQPVISINAITVSEASPFAVLAVSLSNPSSHPVRFQPSLAGGSATIGSDTGASIEWFNGTAWATPGRGVTIAAGATSVLLRVALNNDSDHEGPESFQVVTGAVSGVRNPEGVSGTVTIVDNGSSANTFLPGTTSRFPSAGLADNDSLPIGELSVALLANGSENGPAPAVFRISRSGDSRAPLSVRYSLSGTAIRGLDYAPPAGLDPLSGTGTLIFAADETTLDLPITSLDDALVDGARSINLALVAPSRYTLANGSSSATATITDNDVPPPALPILSLVDHAAGELDQGSSRVVPITLRLSEPSSTPITVGWRTIANGSTATAGLDYQASGDGSVTFAANSLSASFNVTLLGDNSSEGNESIQLELFSPIGAVFAGGASTASGSLTILDNDPSKFLFLDLSTSNNPRALSGNSLNDSLSGGSGADLLNGDLTSSTIGGNDQLTGNGGADVLTGGKGADLFRYPLFSDSTLSNLDNLVDFKASEGDRIGLSALPSALWSRGVITPATPSLAAAAGLAFADKDALTSGNQPLGPGEAVLFAFEATPGQALSRQWHLAVNDGNSPFSGTDDLLLRLSGSQPYSVAGNLIVPSVFSSL